MKVGSSENGTREEGPHPVDVHVGAKVRLRRKFLGITQETLGDEIDLTFQQVQKYERGSNRISASKLWQISQVLKSPISYYFEGIGEAEKSGDYPSDYSEQQVHDFLMTPEGIELAEAFPRIKNAKLRRRILDLVRSVAEDTVDDSDQVPTF
jgi:transcriptional regulator with XRE-family HTH domain